MTDRLLIGNSPLLATLAERLTTLSGGVRVLTTAEGLADSLRETGITVTAPEAITEEYLRELDQPEMVAVFEETHRENLDRCRLVRQAWPDAHLLSYTGGDRLDHTDAIEAIADQVLDPARVTAAHAVEQVGEESRQSRQLWQVLRDIDNLAIVTHDNPDPDAIASGVALARIAGAAGSDPSVCYFGEITHQENRALVNVLNLDLDNVEEGETFDEYDGIALVDHSRPGVNDQLPPETDVDIVIDHHPPRSPIEARFVDLRSDVGATSTLLVDYLERFGIEMETNVATALLFGIHVDTNGFSREISQSDFEAAAKLVQAADFGTLERIETPNISPTTLSTIASAISQRRVEGTVLLSGVGKLHERDALAQAADRLLGLEGITTTLVYGVKDGTIFLSARARGAEFDLGETLREAFDQIGSAGGHTDMAGAQIQLGVLEAVDDENASLYEIVDTVVTSRFLDVLDSRATYQVDGIYPASAESAAYLAVDENGELGDVFESEETAEESTEEDDTTDWEAPAEDD